MTSGFGSKSRIIEIPMNLKSKPTVHCINLAPSNSATVVTLTDVCNLWQYGLWSFQTGAGGTKLERFLPKNQHTQRKLLNFQN